VVVDNPNVGIHWSNQLLVPFIFTANPKDPALPPNDPQALYTGGAFLPPLIPTDNLNLRGYQIIGGGLDNTLMGFLIHLQPKSQGLVKIQSTDPLSIVMVDNNYLGDPDDIKAYVAGFQSYVKPIAQALNQIDSQYNLISPTLDTLNDPTALTNYIIANYNHTHHWMGSNRMAHSIDQGVVDGWGHVFGVDHLMVVDNSISPQMSDGNTSAPIYVLAYIISGYLLEQDRGIPKSLPCKPKCHKRKSHLAKSS
jgi:choline dehydrogenase